MDGMRVQASGGTIGQGMLIFRISDFWENQRKLHSRETARGKGLLNAWNLISRDYVKNEK